MNADQMERVVEAMVGRLNPDAQPPPPNAFEAPGRVSWNQLPRLDLSLSAEIDIWFLSFEARMTAARLPEDHWAAKFLECPSVDESLKIRARDLDPFTFAKLRRTILNEHGPIDPVNFYTRELYRTQGSNAEDVRETLMKLFTLLNRAARDRGAQQLRERDLCYPFLEAFPPNVRAPLERQLALVFAQMHPFEHLYRLAPSKRDVQEECHLATHPFVPEEETMSPTIRGQIVEAVTLALQQVGNGRPEDRKRRRPFRPGSTTNANSTAITPFRRPASGGIPSRQCLGCGGACIDRTACPAVGKSCLKCGIVGHFARVCRKGGPFQQGPARIG